MALGTTGITTSAVGNALGTTSRNVSALCKHTNINKWAKGKPVPYATSVGITDANRKFVNQGLNLNDATSINIGTLFTNAANGKGWNYTPPSGGTNQPFRLGDFRGYNHSATAPFNYNSFPTTVETYSTTANTSFRILVNSGSELDLATDFAHIENFGDLSSWRYAIAYKHSTWANSNIQFMYGPTLAAAGDEIIIEGTFPQTGSYTILPIITKETGTTSDAFESIYLPDGYRSLNVSRKYAYATVTITNESSLTPSLYYEGNLYMFGNMIQLSVTNSTSGVGVSASTGRLKFQILYYDSSGTYLGEFYFTDENNGEFTYSGTGAKSYTLDYNAGAPIYLPDYISCDISQVYRVVIYAEVETVSGSGLFTTAKMYQWECYKN